MRNILMIGMIGLLLLSGSYALASDDTLLSAQSGSQTLIAPQPPPPPIGQNPYGVVNTPQQAVSIAAAVDSQPVPIQVPQAPTIAPGAVTVAAASQTTVAPQQPIVTSPAIATTTGGTTSTATSTTTSAYDSSISAPATIPINPIPVAPPINPPKGPIITTTTNDKGVTTYKIDINGDGVAEYTYEFWMGQNTITFDVNGDKMGDITIIYNDNGTGYYIEIDLNGDGEPDYIYDGRI